MVEEPIELVFISDTGGFPLLSSPRSIVLAGAGSQATIVETYAGSSDDRYCTNAVTEVVLAEGAHVEHFKVQDESDAPSILRRSTSIRVGPAGSPHRWSPSAAHSLAMR